MTSEVTMPQMGADMTEGTLVRWLKVVGDEVARGEVIAEIETDKATVELEAFEGGTLRQLVVDEGETVPVGEIIALLGDEGEPLPAVARKPAAETPARRAIDGAVASTDGSVAATGAPATGASATDAAELPAGRVRVSPVARRIASDAAVDLATVAGSGPDGRILRRDVEAAIEARDAAPPGAPTVAPTVGAAAPAAPPLPATETAPGAGPGSAPDRVDPLTRMRAAIARNMTESKQQQPHYYLTVDVDMTEAMAFRTAMNRVASDDQRVSVNDLIVKACALALGRHPKFNASLTDGGVQYHAEVDINIGIALDEGLIAPAVLDVTAKPLGRIAQETKALVERARAGRLRAEEYSRGTFTITNLGAYGIETLIGIINAGQAAILGVGSVMEQPAARDGEVVVRQLMKFALSADHRVSDGAEGARFLKEIQEILENPASLAL